MAGLLPWLPSLAGMGAAAWEASKFALGGMAVGYGSQAGAKFMTSPDTSRFYVEVDSRESMLVYRQVMAYFINHAQLLRPTVDKYKATHEGKYSASDQSADNGTGADAGAAHYAHGRQADRALPLVGPSGINMYSTDRSILRYKPADGLYEFNFGADNVKITVEISESATGNQSAESKPTAPALLLSVGGGAMAKVVNKVDIANTEMAKPNQQQKQALHDFLLAAEREWCEKMKDRVVVYTNSGSGTFFSQLIKPGRKFDSLVLNKDALDLVADAKQFFDPQRRRSYYARLSIPYRRGYLLHGPPGTGKSSFVLALATELQCPVYQLQLGSGSVTDPMLTAMFNIIPAGSIILLEDLDRLIVKDWETTLDPQALERNKMTTRCGLTLSGLLNTFDGVGAQEGSLLILSSNTPPDRMDPAIIRPGRVDRIVEFPAATAKLAGKLVARFLSLGEDDAAMAGFRAEFDHWGDDPPLPSFATLQGLMLRAHQGHECHCFDEPDDVQQPQQLYYSGSHAGQTPECRDAAIRLLHDEKVTARQAAHAAQAARAAQAVQADAQAQ